MTVERMKMMMLRKVVLMETMTKSMDGDDEAPDEDGENGDDDVADEAEVTAAAAVER